MKLESDVLINFSVDYSGEIESVNVYPENPEIESFIEETLKRVIDQNLLELGERSEGDIKPNRRSLVFDYKVCIEVGEDWNDDKWRNRTLRIPNE